MKKCGALSTVKFILFTIVMLVLVFSSVAITIMNMYKPTLKVSIGNEFIGYFENKQKFDEVYNTLVAEKKQVDSEVKVYLDEEPVFETSYVRNEIIAKENIYTNLRAKVKTEYTTYCVLVDGNKEMTFMTNDEATKYVENFKNEVSKLKVEITSEKVAELDQITTVERADNIFKDIVSRNKPVVLPTVTKKTTVQTTKKATTTTQKASQEVANTANMQGGIWPTKSRYISSPYGWRGSDFHTGTDIAGKGGDAIYAYKSGLVTFSGWNASGYGYLVKVDHGNGISTWYAHCSKLLVSAGDTVEQGQTIALMGSTGRSTGNHLHFEVRINASPVNSYNYIAGK